MKYEKTRKHLRINKIGRYACRKHIGDDGLSEKEFIALPVEQKCRNCNYKLDVRRKKKTGNFGAPLGKTIWPSSETGIIEA